MKLIVMILMMTETDFLLNPILNFVHFLRNLGIFGIIDAILNCLQWTGTITTMFKRNLACSLERENPHKPSQTLVGLLASA